MSSYQPADSNKTAALWNLTNKSTVNVADAVRAIGVHDHLMIGGDM
jgi:hypothetical protein